MSAVVITGCGVVSAIGIGRADFEAAFLGGRAFEDTTGAVGEFDPKGHLGKKGLRALSRSALMLAVASKLALDNAAITVDEDNHHELGLVCGTMFGSVQAISAFDWSTLTDGPKYVNPMHFPNTVINAPAGHVGIKHDLRAVNSTVSAGLASGLMALDYGARLVKEGRVSAVVAGGLDELCEESTLALGHACKLSTRGTAKPLDPAADGTVLGEGAALLVLETAEQAQADGRKSGVRLSGFGSAHPGKAMNTTERSAAAAALAIGSALASARLSPEEIGVIVTGASGSPESDQLERTALDQVFGADRSEIPVVMPKRQIGETMGAGGAFAALAAMLILQSDSAPSADHALVNAFDPQGTCASLILSRWDATTTSG